MRTGGQILVDALRLHGVDTVFCVPGESYLGALDALYDARDSIRVITCRHESGATYAAEAYGKLTGKPGIAFVTRGPGACNACIGVHTALQDSSPMILFVGQVPREFKGREAFQEVDFPAMFGPLAKWATEVDDPARLPEFTARAFATAAGGRPGPVVISLPEDMLVEEVEVADVSVSEYAASEPREDDLARLRDLLSGATKPLVIFGGGSWNAEAVSDLEAFCEANSLPAVASFRTQDIFNNDHPNFIGELGYNTNPKLAQRVKDADLILAIGARLGETATMGYTLVKAPKPDQTLIHVYPDHSELGRVFQADLPIASNLGSFLSQARRHVQVDSSAWMSWLEDGRSDFDVWTVPGEYPGLLNLAEAFVQLRDILPDDAIITTDAGNFAGWTSRFFRFRKFRTLLGPANGSMGYGMPAALAAKAARPDLPVVCYAGDGGIMMTGNELATAVQHDLPIVLMIANNGMFGTIRMHEEREYPGREIATELRNPDFVAWAEAFGAQGERVTTTEEFGPAVERALAAGRPAVIEIMVDQELISSNITLSELQKRARGG
ncbi:MAG: thiamine pyrophosphate-binding protein [Alphaproteobacteria bacterium]|nr:thiamine pyrophosphate-binding protein [Alphaproteobacteria bacterium]